MNMMRTVKAVAWAFLGIRKDSERQQDFGRVNPLAIVAVGLIGVVLFVGVLVALVNWVVP